MNRILLGAAVTLMLVATLAAPLLTTVEAFGFGTRCIGTIFCGRELTATDMGSYIEYVGSLGGAKFVLRIPDKWNGMLVIGCRGYIPSINWNGNPLIAETAQFAVDSLKNGDSVGLPFALVEEGFAYAASSYGEGGFAMDKGMSSTVQLTLFSLNMLHSQFRRCQNIKTYIVGHSMGGAIALMLGAKYPKLCYGLGKYPMLWYELLYPKLYDGVLDISGMKDIVMGYTDSVAGIAQIEYALTHGIYVPPEIVEVTYPLLVKMVADMEAEYGGTYDVKPEAYERTNPVSNAKIRIPMISVNGAQDPVTSPAQGHSFENAVAAAGRSEYYRLYTANPGQHADPDTIDEALLHFAELVDYPVGW